MKHSLLLVAVVALVAFAAPAHSQYMFIDTDNDGDCDANDVLTPASTEVDIWIVTNANADNTPATCNTGPEALNFSSYEFFLRSTGSVTYGPWTDATGFPVTFGDFAAGTDAYHGKCCGSVLAPGSHMLGTLAISGVSAGATLSIVSASSVNPPGYTSFGTECFGSDFDNTYKLPTDWTDVCGTASPTPVTQTTWGQIKNIYR